MLCIHYNAPDMKYIDVAPQIKIDYKEEDETLEEFIKRHADQHIYIDVSTKRRLTNDWNYNFFTKENIERFKNLKQYPNWSLLIDIDIHFLNAYKANLLPEVCNTFVIGTRAETLEGLQYILSFHPNEVYLTNELCFDLSNMKAECEKYGAKIRVVANVAQCEDTNITPAIKRFFIRPEDTGIYNEFVHGIEFYGNKTMQEICFKAYDRRYWWGELSEIIMGLDDTLDSRRVPKHFGGLRIKCGKRCIRGGHCSVCRTIQEFTKVLEKTDTILNQD